MINITIKSASSEQKQWLELFKISCKSVSGLDFSKFDTYINENDLNLHNVIFFVKIELCKLYYRFNSEITYYTDLKTPAYPFSKGDFKAQLDLWCMWKKAKEKRILNENIALENKSFRRHMTRSLDWYDFYILTSTPNQYIFDKFPDTISKILNAIVRELQKEQKTEEDISYIVEELVEKISVKINRNLVKI